MAFPPKFPGTARFIPWFAQSNMARAPEENRRLLTRQILFAFFAALMYGGRLVMAVLPSIHPITLLLGVLTVVYGGRALIPLYLYVILEGLLSGFSLWWLPYLYVFTPAVLLFLLLPKEPGDIRTVKGKLARFFPSLLAALHGFLFGLLYAPGQALLFGLDLQGTVAWWLAGLPFDAIHAVSNFCLGFLIYPLARLVRRLDAGI